MGRGVAPDQSGLQFQLLPRFSFAAPIVKYFTEVMYF